MPVREGDVLDGRFEIGPVAASGGMGVVHRGRDRETGAFVAVKTLRGVEGAERFRREVQVLSGLRHPGIVTYLGHGRTADELYLVMEWLEGEDLGARLDATGVSVEEAVQVGIQLASALAAAHAQGIVHRDVKPSNVFLADWRLDRVKLLDYGIARQAGTTSLTEVGMVVGTPAYMAPEQARGEREIDARTDVYGLGAVLFRCLAGRPPFEAGSAHELLGAVLHQPAPRLTEFVRVPRGLDELLARMLDKSPARRPADGRAACTALSELGSSPDTLSGATLVRDTQRETPASGGGSALSSVAVLPFLDMSAARDQAYLCEGIAEELINTLTQVPGLRVAARSSSFALRSADADARGIGLRLGVAAVLEGGVRKVGDRLRVTVQLVEVAGGSPRWSHRFDGTLDQVFEIQDQIAASVATTLRGMLSTEERDALRRPGTRVAAYEHFLRGRQVLRASLSTVSFQKAEDEFRRAIEIDSGYAPAYAGLAQVYSWRVEWLGGGESAAQIADRASRQALELGPTLAESHLARGDVLSIQKDYSGAERAYEEAIRLNPASFDAYYRYARNCFQSGKYEQSLALFRRGAEVRPEDFQCLILAAMPLEKLGRTDEIPEVRREALRRIERQLELDPNDARALILGSGALLEQDPARALEWVARAVAAAPDEPSVTNNAACTYARMGMKEAALALLTESLGRGLGKRDWIEHDPDYDSLRDDPRFQALLAKLPT